MSIKYFTNNADTGTGSFRAVLATLVSGDVLEPDPDVFKDADVEVSLSSYFATPQAGTYTIRNGAANRIIFNGNDSKYFFAIARAGLSITFEGVDFIHGRRAQNAPFSASSMEAITFRRCGFYNNYGGASGFFRTNSSKQASVLFESCVAFGNRNATTRGQVLDIGSDVVTATIKGCTFGNNYRDGYPDVTSEVEEHCTYIDSLLSQFVDFSTAGFVDLENNDFQLTKESPYISGATAFSEGDLDYLSRPRRPNGALGAFEYYPSGPLEETFGDWGDIARYALGIKTNPDASL